MFLRHARVARFAAAYLLLFTASLVLMVPKVNAPETPFDETTSTNEMVIQTDGASSDNQCLDKAVSTPMMFPQSGMINIRRIFPVYARQLADSHRFQELFELFCTLLC